MSAILHKDLHLEFRVEGIEHTACDIDASQNALLLDQEFLFADGIGGDAAERSVITITDILGETQFDELLDELVDNLFVHGK